MSTTSVSVVQAVTTIRQGERIEAADLRVVEVDAADDVPVVPAERLTELVGQYARTYIGAGALLIDIMVQPSPLVTPGQGVVAVEIRPTRVPRDLRERSQVSVVVVPDDDDEALFVTTGRVVGRTDAESGDGNRKRARLDEPAHCAAPGVAPALLAGALAAGAFAGRTGGSMRTILPPALS